MEAVATTTTCPHGLDARTCLICSTLGMSPDRTSIPAGRPEVLSGPPPSRRRGGVTLLGGLVIAGLVLLVVWLLVGLLWSLLRGAELLIAGALCGYVGYRVGLTVGRHRARPPVR
jgi:hypothetical protein